MHPSDKLYIKGVSQFHNYTGHVAPDTFHSVEEGSNVAPKIYQRTQRDGVAELKAAKLAAKKKRLRAARKARAAK